MVGVIWMVQLVHYPLFAGVGLGNFIEYQKRHQTLMAFVVGPPMLLEASSSVALAWYPPPGVSPWMVFTGIGLVILIWISTAAIQVPCHARLVQGFDARVHRRLVRSNWIRTVAWSVRGLLVAWMLGLVQLGN
jgi:hypothetical protein